MPYLKKHYDDYKGFIVHNNQGDIFLKIVFSMFVLKNPKYSHSGSFSYTIFEYIIDGEGFILYDNVRHAVQSGDCVIIRGNMAKQNIVYGSSTANPYSKFQFAVQGKFIDGMFDAFGITEPLTIKKCDILKLFQDCVMSLSEGKFDPLSSMLAITSIMNAVYNNDIPAAQTDNFDKLVENYIERNMQYPPSPAKAATDLGMSQRDFSEYFKKRYNMSYKQYMQKQRLMHAKKILEHKGDTHSITQIANNLGFCDQSYFSNCFKKEFGVYPKEYRKQIMEWHKKN